MLAPVTATPPPAVALLTVASSSTSRSTRTWPGSGRIVMPQARPTLGSPSGLALPTISAQPLSRKVVRSASNSTTSSSGPCLGGS